jgi:putative transposase
MPEYRRHRVPGGTYFFTLALANRRSDLLVHEITALQAAFNRTRQLHPFQIDAWVVLPEHMHAVWTLPDGESDYSLRWTLIKRWFSAAIPKNETRSETRAAKGERAIWQRRFWEHMVRDPNDFARRVDYVHINQVKHGLVARAIDWLHSSFRRAFVLWHYPADWAMSISMPWTLPDAYLRPKQGSRRGRRRGGFRGPG